MREPSRADQDFQNFIEPLNKECRSSQRQNRHHPQMIIDLLQPLRVLMAYHSNEKVREFTNNVAKLCTKPTFIPVLHNTVSTPGQPGIIWSSTFILAHAVQILLSAPQDWNSYRVYSRDRRAYAHRFPTPETIGGGTTRTVAGLFSMEGLYRAVLLFYYLLKRRSATKWITKTAPTSSSSAEFPGYHRPTSPAMDQDALQNLNEPRLNETAPGVPNERPLVNKVDVVTANSESDQSDEDENESDQSDEDADAPEILDETETIEGLKTIRTNTLLLESLTTTRPSESLSQRLQDLDEPDLPAISVKMLRQELDFLVEHHGQPDFESILSKSRKFETRVAFDLGVSYMKHLVQRPVCGEWLPTQCSFQAGLLELHLSNRALAFYYSLSKFQCQPAIPFCRG
jgi:hypothetical protein